MQTNDDFELVPDVERPRRRSMGSLELDCFRSNTEEGVRLILGLAKASGIDKKVQDWHEARRLFETKNKFGVPIRDDAQGELYLRKAWR